MLENPTRWLPLGNEGTLLKRKEFSIQIYAKMNVLVSSNGTKCTFRHLSCAYLPQTSKILEQRDRTLEGPKAVYINNPKKRKDRYIFHYQAYQE